MTNEEQFYQMLSRVDPELYLIKIALDQTGVNAQILPRVIRSLANLAYGTGFGRVQIFMSEKVVTQIKPEESDQLNFPAFSDKVESDQS